jgi:hypothetical protein
MDELDLGVGKDCRMKGHCLPMNLQCCACLSSNFLDRESVIRKLEAKMVC